MKMKRHSSQQELDLYLLVKCHRIFLLQCIVVYQRRLLLLLVTASSELNLLLIVRDWQEFLSREKNTLSSNVRKPDLMFTTEALCC